jgi:hypothetical protein
MRTAPSLLLIVAMATADASLPESAIQSFVDTTRYVFGLPDRPDVDHYLRESVVKHWQKPDGQKNIASVLKLSEDLKGMPAAQRDAVRYLVRSSALADQRKKATEGDPDAMWLIREFDQAHPPIAKGDPPLTREIVDAYVELLRTVEHPKAPKDDGAKEHLVRKLANEYPSLPATAQQQVQRLPLIMAAVRWQMPSMDPEQQARLKQGLRMHYAPTSEDRAIMQQMQRGMASLQQKMIQQSWNSFMGNMENIYGSSRWNPATGRYDVNPGMRTTIP